MTPTPDTWRALVPPAKHEAVATALRSAFGAAEVEVATLLTGGGSSAVVLRAVVGAHPYVLRVIQDVHAFNDPARHFACMAAAADAGISPPVRYAADAVSITDFVAAVPLRDYPGSPLVALAATIKAIQGMPPFPALVSSLDAVAGLIATFRALGVLPEPATREHFERFAELQDAFAREGPADLVSSHNDLNPRNVLFDGTRLWVVDWEAAFRNDSYADLASVANFFFQDEPATGEPGPEEETLLGAYFGAAPDARRRARFFLMRQVCSMAYALLLMLSAARDAARRDEDTGTPRLRDFHRRFAAGAAGLDPLASADGQFLYGKVWLNEALHHMRTPRFAASLRLMS